MMAQGLIRAARKGLLGLILTVCLLFILGNWPVLPPVIASVHQYGEGSDQLMYRSLQTLRDDQDLAWQVVLFKRLERGQTTALHLRLVGFPGLVTVSHPAALTIATGEDRVWQGTDITEVPALSSNVGEYDVLEVLRAIEGAPPLRLFVPLADHPRELVIPPYVVQEWQKVARDLV
ncbi:MAG: DUF3122 domain-containing protein [Leptolyngbyaceae cyanobacterium bins.59]|nr:DUF3122 domain-containing protein [Leptolyngbyaceae cyanobacterium bins.59]